MSTSTPSADAIPIAEMFKKVHRNRALSVNAMTFNQIAFVWLGKGDDANAARVAQMVATHPRYFVNAGPYRVKFRWDEIMCDYGVHMYGEHAVPLLAPHYEPPKSEVEWILAALSDERRDSELQWQQHPVRVHRFDSLQTNAVTGYCYQCTIEDSDDDEPVALLEGMKVKVEWTQDIRGLAKLLVYDPLQSRMVLEFQRPLSGAAPDRAAIRPDTAWLIDAYKEYVSDLDGGLCGHLRDGGQALGDHHAVPLWPEALDLTQRRLIETALANSVTYLWGPPGTGKTFTLAALIADLIAAGRRVFAAAISNAAIDVLAVAVVNRLKQHPGGEKATSDRRLLRYGFPGDEALKHPELFPHHQEADSLRTQLRALRERRSKTKDVEAKASLQQQIDAVRKGLDDIIKGALSHAHAVFTTICQAAISSHLHQTEPFDTAICDEASMANMIHMLPLARLAQHRLIIAGDPKQLGPVVISQTPAAKKILLRSVFDLRTDRPLAGQNPEVMLTHQRRMHDSICQLINAAFYHGELVTAVRRVPSPAPHLRNPDFRALFVNVDDGQVEYTPRRSRRNRRNVEVDLSLLLPVLRMTEGTVGIIAPYRAQVGLLRHELKRMPLTDEDRSRVSVGTVHAFQGGERDVIVWDLVDCAPDKPGLLYLKKAGDRLSNVAISRARSVIYLVGHLETFLHSERVHHLHTVLAELRRGRHVIPASDLVRGQNAAVTTA